MRLHFDFSLCLLLSMRMLLLLVMLASSAVAAFKQSLECDTCELILKGIVDISNSSTLAGIVAGFDKGCEKIFGNHSDIGKACNKLASVVASGLKALPDLVQDGQYPIPVACAILADGVCKLPCCTEDNVPEQVYITFAANNSMRATWITLKPPPIVMVQWGTDNLTHSATGYSLSYSKGGFVGSIHHAFMIDIVPGKTYQYRVGDGNSSFSPVYSFKVSNGYPSKVAIVGDMGIGARGNGTMAKLLAYGSSLDFVLHIGDIAYADGNMQIWDTFGRQRPFAAVIPYMTIPGNHEIAFDFASYRARYPMSLSPTSGGSSLANAEMYWAFDDGRVRYIGLDSESELDIPEIDKTQLAWITNELKTSSARKKNGELDWIIVSLHRPMYCSSLDIRDCAEFAQYLRGKLEDLFMVHLVDLVFQAHRHNYERTTPVYNSTVMDEGTAPTYVLNGIGGSREGNSHGLDGPGPPWRAVAYDKAPNSTSSEETLFGYGLLTVTPKVLSYEEYLDDDSHPLDQFTLKPRVQ